MNAAAIFMSQANTATIDQLLRRTLVRSIILLGISPVPHKMMDFFFSVLQEVA
jgi:hypothetical protein